MQNLFQTASGMPPIGIQRGTERIIRAPGGSRSTGRTQSASLAVRQGDATIDIAKDDAATFIARWKGVPASELSASQSFLSDLCRLLGVPVPHPTAEQDYLFERPITFHRPDGSTSPGRVDLYKRGHFVLESKKLDAGKRGGKGMDAALQLAHSQAESYIRALPASEGRPPFLIVVDVGHRLDLYAEFSRSGGSYTPFPDSRHHRIGIDDLARDDIRERLRRIWQDPMSLDPSRESAKVTREIASRLAELAKSLEAARHPPEVVAQFLMRCLFTMFAEDVRLLPEASFTNLLNEHAEDPDTAMRMVESLWADMDHGRFSAAIRKPVLRFNGKLFKQTDTLPLTKAQLALLISAAKADWRHVEPAIFGTLLERALSPIERHKLGAHYTPRAYVERLVLPTVIEPLRREWRDALAAALTLNAEKNGHDEAIRELLRFHHRLCNVRVLDPACGSGNFLYVTLEHLKRLEGEVLTALDDMGYRQEGLALGGDRADGGKGETVDPHNLLGIELNPRAAAIAEVVLWIGYLQWHFRTRGNVDPPVPVVRDFANIENRDAVLAWDRIEFVTDEHGRPLTRWDGRTMKASPITGEPIPDDSARVPLERYLNPRKAEWPVADFVVGNPPFLGKGESMRSALGDGYLDALRSTWPAVPESADFVMYWWHKAAELTRAGALERFGFITTNSIKQTFNRRVIEAALSAGKEAGHAPLSLAFAIPDHPWVDAADGAAVRIAMTVGERTTGVEGKRVEVIAEAEGADDEITVTLRERSGLIHADLSTGADVTQCAALRANERLSSMGVMLAGSGFIVTPDEAEQLGLGKTPGLEQRIREYRNGRDLTDSPRGVRVIDLHGLDEAQVRDRYPSLFQRVVERVKPERDSNRRDRMRLKWWLFAENRPTLRAATHNSNRYIAAVETAKHKTFQFLDSAVLPDHKLVAIALSESAFLGVMSSRLHVCWALKSGSTLEDRPVYVKSRCFEPFPFPFTITLSSCWVDSTTVWMRCGVPSALYSTVTCDLASGRSQPSLPFFRSSAWWATSRCDRSMGRGMRVGVSSQANPNIIPWSPAPPVSTPWLMCGLWAWMTLFTCTVLAANPMVGSVYPMSVITSRTRRSTASRVSGALVVISPATVQWSVVTSVSHATRLIGSAARQKSRTASEIWSATLSGWPIDTDSLVNR